MSDINFQPHIDLKTGGWTSIPNNLIRDGNILSDSSLRLLAYLLSNREGWKVFQTKIKIDLRWGREKLSNAMKGLENNGFLYRKWVRNEFGRFAIDYYEFHVFPVYKSLTKKRPPNSKNVSDNGLPDIGSSDIGKPCTTNTNIKEEQIKDLPPPPSSKLPKAKSIASLKKKMISSLGCSNEEYDESWKRYLAHGDVKNVEAWLEPTIKSVMIEFEAKRSVEAELERKRAEEAANALHEQSLKQAELEKKRIWIEENRELGKKFLEKLPNKDYAYHENYIKFKLNGSTDPILLAFDDPGFRKHIDQWRWK